VDRPLGGDVTNPRRVDPATKAALAPLYARRRELGAERKELRAELRATRVRHRPDAVTGIQSPVGSRRRPAFEAAIVGDAARLAEALGSHEARLAEVDRELALVEAEIARLRGVPAPDGAGDP
jgi:hypothetical protein